MIRTVKERVEDLLADNKTNSLAIVILELDNLSSHGGVTDEEKRLFTEIKNNLSKELDVLKTMIEEC